MDKANDGTPLIGGTMLHFKNFTLAWVIIWVGMVVCALVLRFFEFTDEYETTKASQRHYDKLMEYARDQPDDEVESDIESVLVWMEEEGDCGRPNLAKFDWAFGSSMYLTFQLITSIGYGVFAPVTWGGRITSVIIVIFGIPLYNRATGMLVAYLDYGIESARAKIWKDEQSYTAAGFLGMTTCWLLGWMCIGSVLFLHKKPNTDLHFTFFEGLYFTFITITTVGLGDFTYDNTFTRPVGIVWTITGIGLFNLWLSRFTECCQSWAASRFGRSAPQEGDAPPPKEAFWKELGLFGRNLGIFTLMLLVGGAVMMPLEHPREKKMAKVWIDMLARHERNLNDDGKESLNAIIDDMTTGGICSVPEEGEWNWTFEGSVFFFFTVFVTIGYGFYAPKTTLGRVFTILLALPGFVVANLLLESLAKLPALALLAFEKPEGEATTKLAALLALREKGLARTLAAILLLVLGAVTFAVFPGADEGGNGDGSWAFSDSMWFWFITWTTVGFGDFGPEDWDQPLSVIFTMAFSLLGLAFFAVCLTDVEENVMDKFVSFGDEKAQRERLDAGEEGQADSSWQSSAKVFPSPYEPTPKPQEVPTGSDMVAAAPIDAGAVDAPASGHVFAGTPVDAGALSPGEEHENALRPPPRLPPLPAMA